MIVENICCQGSVFGYEFYFRSKAHPEFKKLDKTWSNKPAVIDYTYLRIILEGGKAVTYSVEAGFHDADNDHLEECASMSVDLSEHTNELKKAVIKVMLDRFF